VHLRGPQLMRGYWNNEAATREAFDGEWYRTGDLGRHDEDGALVIVDRKKNMLISGGVNIYPAEVERALASIPGIAECVVLGLPSTQWGEEVAAIVYAPSLNETAPILEQARSLLGAVKAPKRLRLSPKPLPKTASNKIARTGLSELFASLG
jgi:fatty-acyl-CoA synthase